MGKKELQKNKVKELKDNPEVDKGAETNANETSMVSNQTATPSSIKKRTIIKKIFLFRAMLFGLYFGIVFGFVLAYIFYSTGMIVLSELEPYKEAASQTGYSLNLFSEEQLFMYSLISWGIMILGCPILAAAIASSYNLFAALGAPIHLSLVIKD